MTCPFPPLPQLCGRSSTSEKCIQEAGLLSNLGISVELQFHPTRGRTLTSHLTQGHVIQTLFPLGKTEWIGAANPHPVPIHTVRSLPKVQQAENFGTQWPLPHLPVQQFHTGKDKSGHIYRRQNRLSLKNHKKRQRQIYTMIKR